MQGKDGGSTIDWVVANKPDNIIQTKAEWTGSGADHAIIWAIKEMREKFRKKQMTRKRIWKKFEMGELKREADKIEWKVNGELTSRASLEEAVINLESSV